MMQRLLNGRFNEKMLMMENEVIARGALEADVSCAVSYP